MEKIKRRCIEILVIFIVFVKLGGADRIVEHCYEVKSTSLICNYIPTTLPRLYKHVRIVDLERKGREFIINSSSFIHESWAKVQTIEFNGTTEQGYTPWCTFSRECFKGLISLKEMKIHVGCFDLDAYAFVGLQAVHTLDVSKSHRLLIQTLLKALEVKSALPALQTLIMSDIGTYWSNANTINQKDVDYILPRNITKIDLSGTQMNFVNMTAIHKTLHTLESLNMSYTVIDNVWTENIVEQGVLNLMVFDLANCILPARAIPNFPGKYVFANIAINISQIKNIELNKIFTNPLISNLSGIIPSATSFWGYNITITIDEPQNWKVKELILRNNNLRYLDVDFVCPVYKLRSVLHIDLSHNGLEMVYPCECIPNLETYILSNNKLFEMLGKRSDRFGKLLASYSKLRVINLANNRLGEIPKHMFQHNKELVKIDLSFNQLEQLHFNLVDLHYLRVLDVSNNNIKVLDEISINNLNAVPCASSNIYVDDHCIVVMKSNPLLCSTCDCKSSIQWLLISMEFNLEQQALVCMSDDGTFRKIEKSVVKRIQNICNRKLVIITSTVCIIVTFMTLCIIGIILHRTMRRLKRKRKMENVLARLKEGEGQYEFVAFLSYSSDDYQFVHDHVIDQLNENLQLIIGTDRRLLCTGDQDVRLGFNVPDETVLCLNRVSVVIVLVSDTFCRNLYCKNEFDQAFLQQKPIVFMRLGNVDEQLMMPTLKSLYKNGASILWEFKNGELVLKDTWESVCSLVLEKVQV